MNKKWWIVMAVVVVIGGLGLAGYRYIGGRQQAQAEAQEAMETAVVRRDTLRVTLDATGSLAPQAEVSLAFASSGQVADVFVAEGEQVEAGQALAQLDTNDLALQVTQAEISLREAELDLETLQEPADEADVEQAQVHFRPVKIEKSHHRFIIPLEVAGMKIIMGRDHQQALDFLRGNRVALDDTENGLQICLVIRLIPLPSMKIVRNGQVFLEEVW